jgi:isopenicillin-N epimerase
VNLENSYYARGAYSADFEAIRARVAEALRVELTQIALTRGATEALQCLIGGYKRLRPGDAVIYADVDYPSMQYAMKWLADRRGVRVVRVVVPEPVTHCRDRCQSGARNPWVRDKSMRSSAISSRRARPSSVL